MENLEDKKLDALVSEWVKEVGVSQPSTNFAHNVMQKVSELGRPSSVTSYTPPISKLVWLIVGVCVVAIIGYTLLYGGDTSAWKLPFSANAFKKPIELPDSWTPDLNLHVGTIVTYAIIGVGWVLMAQIFMIKRQFNKRFRV